MFNTRLREMRKKFNMRQEDLAQKIGVGKSTIAGYEKGFRRPKLETINELADIFNTSSDYLLGLTENPSPKEPSKELSELFKEDDYTYKGKPINNRDLEFILKYLDNVTEDNTNTNDNDEKKLEELSRDL